jgi:hypothetical protein
MRSESSKIWTIIAVAEWLLDRALASPRHYEEAVKWVELSANVLSQTDYLLVSSLVCGCYPPFCRRRAIETALPLPSGKEVCLHVLNEAFAFGGLTAMAARWIQLDSESRIHHVALLDQKTDPSPELVESAAATGGQVFSANSCSSILLKAAWLRDLARDHATYVVLHINVNDVIAGLAFGSPGGPPVLLVNHAAHIFWVGASLPDLVVNCRGSQLEEYWSRAHRGASTCATIPSL